MISFPQFKTDRMLVRHVQPGDAQMVLHYYQKNRAHLAAWEPEKPADFYTTEQTHARITIMQDNFLNDRGVHFIALTPDKHTVLATCNFSNIMRGMFQACYLGFSLDEQHQGQGLMHELLQPCIYYMFTQKKLHRIMANHLPHNFRSARLLHQLGFRREGYARDFLKIAGKWQDHVLRAKIFADE